MVIIVVIVIIYKMVQCFAKPYERSGENINVKLDLSHFLCNKALKGATGSNISNSAAKSYLNNLKAEVK